MSASITPHGFIIATVHMVAVVATGAYLPATAQLAASFEVTPAQVSATMAAYLIVGVILQLAVGSISDFLGRRRFTLLCIGVFVGSSIGCALAESLFAFTIFRMLQGFATVLAVLSRAIVADTRKGDEASALLAYIASAMAVVTILSPIVGGAIAQGFGWTMSFYFIALLGAGAFVLCWRYLPETVERRKLSSANVFADYVTALSSFRFLGFALAIAASLATYYVFLTAAPIAGVRLFDEAALGAFLSTMTVGFLAGSFLSARMATRIGAYRTALIGRVTSVFGLVAGLIVMTVSGSEALLFLVFPVFLAGAGDGITVPAATGSMLDDDNLAAGTGAALSGVAVLIFGAIASVLVGHIAENGLAFSSLFAMMLVPATISLLPLVLVRKAQTAQRAV